MKAIGMKQGNKHIRHRLVAATDKVARALRVEVGDPIIEITRVRLADNVPILLEMACLSTTRFPSLVDYDWIGRRLNHYTKC